MARFATVLVGCLAVLAANALSARAETLAIPGLSAPATLQTDDLGVPHITAVTLEDAFRVQGWVAARDRLFSMDRGRRGASGTLAAFTGNAADLNSDALARSVDIPAAARRSAELLTPEVRALYQAYADGVNAWLATHPLPSEYAELEVSQVPPWSVLDSIAMFKASWASIDNRSWEIADTNQLAQYIAAGPVCGVDGGALFEDDVVRVAPIVPVATVPDAGGAGAVLAPGGARASSREVAPARRPAGHGLSVGLRRRLEAVPWLGQLKREPDRGSNAWGVAASKTASGRPLVAGDPHLGLSIPAPYEPMHLVVTADPVHGVLNLSGSHSPGGLPGVFITAQNQHVVWSATNFAPDVVDIFVDRLVRGDPACPARLCIESAGALHPVEESSATYRLNVRGDGTLDNTVDVTAFVPREAVRILRVPFRSFGPIVLVEDLNVVDDGGTSPAETQVLTFQYTGLHGTRDHAAWIDLQTATTIAEFVAAARRFSQQHFHFVVADRAGGLAYVAGGELPLRADLEAGTVYDDGPQYVRDGSGPGNWVPDPARAQGQDIPFAILPKDEMPEVVNPPSGFVATANRDAFADALDNDLYNQFRPSKPGAIRYVGPAYIDGGLRAARITQLLRQKIDAGEPFTVADMRRMQTDGSPHDATLMVPFLVAAWTHAQAAGAPPALAAFVTDPGVAEAMGRLAAWDFTAPTGIPEGWDASDPDGVRNPAVPPAEVAASVATTIYQVWRAELLDAVIIAGLARCGLEQSFDVGSLVGLHELLAAEPFTGIGVSGLDFFPEPATLAAADRRDVVLLQALRDTLDLLPSNVFASAFGNSTNQDDYRWGRLHRLVFAHVLGGARSIPPAAGFTDLDVGLPGLARDGAWGAINVTDVASLRAKRPKDFVSGYTAVVRWIAEPTPVAGDEDGLRAISSFRGGASEHVESPFYANRLARWLTGDYDDVLVTPAQIAPLPAENASVVAATSSQQRCVEEMNKRGAAVGKAQGREAAGCLEQAAAGKQDDPQACLTADAEGKVAKARDKADAGQASKCAERPVFAYAGADAAADAGAEAALALAQDLFGADLHAAVIAKKNDPVGAACQAEFLKRAQKAVERIWTETRKSKKAAMAGKKGVAPANSGTAVQEALAAVFAPNAQVEQALGKITSGATKKCDGVADLAAAVPGRCAGADVANVAGCVRARVLCRACRSVNAMDALALPCDTLDDGQVDAGCG